MTENLLTMESVELRIEKAKDKASAAESLVLASTLLAGIAGVFIVFSMEAIDRIESEEWRKDNVTLILHLTSAFIQVLTLFGNLFVLAVFTGQMFVVRRILHSNSALIKEYNQLQRTTVTLTEKQLQQQQRQKQQLETMAENAHIFLTRDIVIYRYYALVLTTLSPSFLMAGVAFSVSAHIRLDECRYPVLGTTLLITVFMGMLAVKLKGLNDKYTVKDYAKEQETMRLSL
eukprot:m.346096 g.346096  ORF g.346096 m.346096 type:complete len:231 (+) comp28122_c0_seq1:253-945(+)